MTRLGQEAVDGNAAGLPRTLWTLWLQGWDTAPLTVRRCLETMRSANPEWQVEALDRSSLEDHLPPALLRHLDTLKITPTGYSNLIRLLLLQRHGGVWMDATCTCATPLDLWIHELARMGFFAFARPVPDREFASWFLAAHPRNDLVDALLAASLGYWNARGEAHTYHWLHGLFAELTANHDTFARRWARVPKVTARHIFHFGPGARRLLEPPTAGDLNALADPPAPVFKLTTKVDGQDGGEHIPDGSLIERLLAADPFDPIRMAAVREWAKDMRHRVNPDRPRKRRASTERRIVLHVGLPKAASSAFQVWCDTNRDWLARYGIDYPPTGGASVFEPKHQTLVRALRENRLDLLNPLINNSMLPTLVLSAEGLTGHLPDFPEDALEAFREMLVAHHVTMFVIDREPLAWARSYWRQKVTNPQVGQFDHGTPLTFEAFLKRPRMVELMDRPALMTRLIEAYEPDRVDVADVEDGWFASALKVMGLDMSADELRAEGMEPPPRTNEGVTNDTAELIRQVNALALKPVQRNAVLQRFQQVLKTNNTSIMTAAARAADDAAGPDPAPWLDKLVPANEEQARLMSALTNDREGRRS